MLPFPVTSPFLSCFFALICWWLEHNITQTHISVRRHPLPPRGPLNGQGNACPLPRPLFSLPPDSSLQAFSPWGLFTLLSASSKTTLCICFKVIYVLLRQAQARLWAHTDGLKWSLGDCFCGARVGGTAVSAGRSMALSCWDDVSCFPPLFLFQKMSIISIQTYLNARCFQRTFDSFCQPISSVSSHQTPCAICRAQPFKLLGVQPLCIAKVCSAMSSVATASVQHGHIDRMF